MYIFVSLLSFRSDTNAAHVEFWLDKGYGLGFFTSVLQCKALFNSCSIFILYYPYAVQEVHHHAFLSCFRLHVWPETWQDIQYGLLTDHQILAVTAKIRILLTHILYWNQCLSRPLLLWVVSWSWPPYCFTFYNKEDRLEI
jgi:hypothetical protein